jgi:hypothetical protein
MDLITALFSVARQISDTDIDEINKLEVKAKAETSKYHTEQGGVKGLYAKLHKGFMLQLGLIFLVPFVVNYFIKLKSNILSNSSPELQDFEDNDEEELYYKLKNKYEE